MTRKQRMLAAINLQPVDRIPHATYNIHPYLPTVHSEDGSYFEILEQIRKTAGVAVKITGMLSGYALSNAAEQNCDSVSIEDQDGFTTITTVHTPAGDLTSEARYPKGQPSYTIKHLIESDQDLDRYFSIPYQTPDTNIDAIKTLYDAIGDNGLVLVGFEDPMYAIASLMDFEDFCIKCITDLEKLRSAVEWACERSLANVKTLCEACRGMDVLIHTSGPELCTPPMVSPRIFPVLVTPFLAKIIDTIHSYGLKAAIHCHGHVREVFPEMLKTGADLLEPIEPPDQGNISLEELMQLAEGKICLMGHVQDQEFYFDVPNYFYNWTKHVAQIVNGRTGYIMSPTCTPFSHPCGETYKRNYLEWLRAADSLL